MKDLVLHSLDQYCLLRELCIHSLDMESENRFPETFRDHNVLSVVNLVQWHGQGR